MMHMDKTSRPPGPACPCCGPLPGLARRQTLGRRRALGLGGAVAATVWAATPARAGAGDYEAMLVNCIDPRFVVHSAAHMATQGLGGRFSQFVIAGGPIGAVHPRFAGWHQTFWDNLAVSVDLHRIRRVVALTHRDCGAAKLAFGEAGLATPAAEAAAHRDALRHFAAEVRRRHPALRVEAGLTALSGVVEPVL